MGFTEVDGHPPLGGILPPPFHPYPRSQRPRGRFAFCCTFPNLSAGRRYRPSRSLEPGLSSPHIEFKKSPLRIQLRKAIALPPGPQRLYLTAPEKEQAKQPAIKYKST